MEISLVLSDTCGYHEETKEILKQAMEEAGVEADVTVTVISCSCPFIFTVLVFYTVHHSFHKDVESGFHVFSQFLTN